MMSEEEAREKIFASLALLTIEEATLADALDRFAANDVIASVPIPPFDNSAMDGYAVFASSARKGARLKIIGEQPAGVARNLRVANGEAVRIFTGAPMPQGADAVVMQEETNRAGEEVVISCDSVSAGEFVRKAGADLTPGQKILGAGQCLRATTLSLLASQGMSSVRVFQRVRVAILTTGDEAVPPGNQLQPGQIFESNGVMLSALAKKIGAEIFQARHCRDNFEELRDVVAAASSADALIISGGVSVGEHDLVRKALEANGAAIDMWRVSVKPGKPFLFGKIKSCCVFGLPGNPVSSFVTFQIFVRPALLKMMGAVADELALPQTIARLADDITGDDERPHYVRGKLRQSVFAPVGRQESHALFGLASANGLLRVMPRQQLAAGTETPIFLLD